MGSKKKRDGVWIIEITNPYGYEVGRMSWKSAIDKGWRVQYRIIPADWDENKAVLFNLALWEADKKGNREI